MVFGTPEFMSPEQAQGKVLDARSDVYSLAVILYEVLTGKLPFDAKTPMEFIQQHVMTRPIPLDERVPTLRFPPGLGDVLARALAKDPADRFATAAAFGQALEPFAYGRTPGSNPQPSAPAAPFSTSPVVVSQSIPSQPVAPLSTMAPRSQAAIFAAVAVGALLIGALLAVGIMQFIK
jgi:serine/threonine-protein kinase